MSNTVNQEEIKKEAKEYLMTIYSEVGSNSINQVIDEAIRTNTMEGYWKLLEQLRETREEKGDLYNRLVDYIGNNEAFTFVNNLSKILNGEV